MELLVRYGTEQQKARWLGPLLEGRTRSCFAMTEPQVPHPGVPFQARPLPGPTWSLPRGRRALAISAGCALPQVASSDATNIESSIREEDGFYVINGHKWWISGIWPEILFQLHFSGSVLISVSLSDLERW